MGHSRNLANTYPGYFTLVSVTILLAPCDRVFFSIGTTNLITSLRICGSSILANAWRHCRKRSISFVATQLSKYHIGSSSSSICKRSHNLLAKSTVDDGTIVLRVSWSWRLAILCCARDSIERLRNDAVWLLYFRYWIGNSCHDTTNVLELRHTSTFTRKNTDTTVVQNSSDVLLYLGLCGSHCRGIAAAEPVNRYLLITGSRHTQVPGTIRIVVVYGYWVLVCSINCENMGDGCGFLQLMSYHYST